jgi:hypothetical protein
MQWPQKAQEAQKGATLTKVNFHPPQTIRFTGGNEGNGDTIHTQLPLFPSVRFSGQLL